MTEYGVADLYGKTIRQRARALINIAHPNFREELSSPRPRAELPARAVHWCQPEGLEGFGKEAE